MGVEVEIGGRGSAHTEPRPNGAARAQREVMDYNVDVRKAIAQASYTDMLTDGRLQEDARIRLAYFVVTATLGILGYYVHLRSGFATDPSRVSLANYLFPTGFLLQYVIMRISQGRYKEECLTLDGAREVEQSQKIFDGAAARKLDRYHAAGFWTPSRSAVASTGCAIALFVTMLIHHWQH